MRTGLKILGIFIIVLAVLGLASWGVRTWFSRQAIPKASGTIRVAGLGQPVEVVRDQYGVAHLPIPPDELGAGRCRAGQASSIGVRAG